MSVNIDSVQQNRPVKWNQKEMVTVEFLGASVEAELEFYFYAGAPAKTDSIPENCDPGEPDIYELISLKVPEQAFQEEIDLTNIMGWIEEPLIEQLREKQGKNNEEDAYAML